jgi:ABC-type nitrate/sulfonate/bicarbonate transport system substrate-binding protein
MRGKTIAVTIGAADDFVARLLVRRGGLDVRDVSFVNMAARARVFPRSRQGESMRLRFHCPFS